VVKTTFGIGPPDLASLPAKIPALEKFARVLDAHLAGRTHVACGRLTIADFQLASMAAYWRQSDMPLAAFPAIVRWLDALQRIPAWADPWPAKALAPA
jgi:glutathione S-transferase